MATPVTGPSPASPEGPSCTSYRAIWAVQSSRPLGVWVAAQPRRPRPRAACSSAATSAWDACPPVCRTRPWPHDRPDQLRGGAGGRGGGLLPSVGGAVRLRYGVHDPGQSVGEALLGQRVPLQADEDADRALLGLLDALLLGRGRGVEGVLEDQRVALREGALHGRVRIRHRALGERGGERRGVESGVPGEGRLLEEPYGDRPPAPLVVRAALRAEQRAGEPVGLLGPHPGDPQQLPGVLAQLVVSALAECREGPRCEGVGGAALVQHGAYGGDGFRCEGRRGLGRGGHRLRTRHGLRGDRPARRRLGLTERGGHGLLAAFHGPHRREQIGGRPAELGPGRDRPLLLGLPPLDPLPLQPLRRQLGRCLGQFCGVRRAVGFRAALDRVLALDRVRDRGRVCIRVRIRVHVLRVGGRSRARRPRLHFLRGLGLRAHSVLQS